MHPPAEGEGLHVLAELTLVLTLFSDAARIDVSKLGRQHSLPIRLLLLGLPLAMILGTLGAKLIYPDFSWGEAAVLGVLLSPTDAALGQAVVTDTRLPERIRQALNVESGLNDGLAYPVFFVAASIAAEEAGRSLPGWAGFVAEQVTLGPLMGSAVGYLGAKLVERASQKQWMSPVFEKLSVLGVAPIAFASAELVGGNGFIAAFVAGMWVGRLSPHLVKAIESLAACGFARFTPELRHHGA